MFACENLHNGTWESPTSPIIMMPGLSWEPRHGPSPLPTSCTHPLWQQTGYDTLGLHETLSPLKDPNGRFIHSELVLHHDFPTCEGLKWTTQSLGIGNPHNYYVTALQLGNFVACEANGQICSSPIHHFYELSSKSSKQRIWDSQQVFLCCWFSPFYIKMTILQRFGQLIHTIHPAASPNASTAAWLDQLPKSYTWELVHGTSFSSFSKASPNTTYVSKWRNTKNQGYKKLENPEQKNTNLRKLKELFVKPWHWHSKEMGCFCLKARNPCKSKQPNLGVSASTKLWKDARINLWPSACPYRSYGRDPLPKVGCHLPTWTARFNAGFAGQRLDSPAWQSLTSDDSFLLGIETKNFCSLLSEKQKSSGTLSYPRAIIFK